MAYDKRMKRETLIDIAAPLDQNFWVDIDHRQVVVKLHINATKCPNVDNVGELPSINRNVCDLRFCLLQRSADVTIREAVQKEGAYE